MTDGCELGHHDWEMEPFVLPMAPHMIHSRTCSCCGLKDKTSNWTGLWDFEEMDFEARMAAYRERRRDASA